MIWYYFRRPDVILRVLISERERQEGQLLALEMEESAMSQGMQAASGRWKKGNASSPRAFRKNKALTAP